MASFLVLYGTGEGQTEKVATHIGDVLIDRGHEATTVDASEISPDFAIDDFDAILVGASIHAGKHQPSIREFVTTNRDTLATKPTAFFQVSLSSADEGGEAQAAGYVEEFIEGTDWHPDRIGLFGGALRYTKYGFLKRLVMKQIAKRKVTEMPETDPSGDVSARKLLDVLDEEGIDQAVLVGQSMGSLINQYVAYHHPDRVRALVHVEGFPLHDGFSERTIKLMGVHVWLLKLMPEKLACDMFGRLVARTPEAQEYARQASARTGKANMVSLERVFLEDIEEGIPELSELPQLVVAGEHGYSMLRKKAKEWDERLPDSEYVTVPNAGHLANHDNPTAFNETLSSFLETLD